MKSRLAIYIFLALVLCSCQPRIEIDSLEKQKFLEETEVGCYKNGIPYIVYKPGHHQLSINNKRRVIRVQNDNQSEFYHMSLDSYPRSIGVNILSEVAVGAMGEIAEYTFLFECSKMEDGKIWLWNKENKLGIVMPI